MSTTGKIHPLVAGAAVSLIIVSGIGAASILGWLPNSNSSQHNTPVATIEAPTSNQVAAVTPAVEPAPSVVAPAAPAAPIPQAAPPVVETAPVPHPVNKPQPVVKHNKPHPTPAPVAQSNEGGYVEPNSPQPVQAAPVCGNCGVISSISQVERATGEANGVGAVGGAVLGGILGHQVGGGSGRDIATVLGALGGGVAGHNVEKRVRTEKVYEIRVRMDDGSSRTITQKDPSGWQSGQRVQVSNGSLSPM